MEELEDHQEQQALRLVNLANFLAGLIVEYPAAETLRIIKQPKGYEMEYDNLTFSWAFGLMPFVFPNQWAYSKAETVILKSSPELSTFHAIKLFFGLTTTEYFHVFVAYFQDVNSFGGKDLPHQLLNGKDIAFNIRELIKAKAKIRSMISR